MPEETPTTDQASTGTPATPPTTAEASTQPAVSGAPEAPSNQPEGAAETAFGPDELVEDEGATDVPLPGPAEEDWPGPEEVAEAEMSVGPTAATEEVPASNKHWYVVKVQSGREESIKEAIERRVRKEGLEEFFGQIVIPVERYTEVRTN